MVYSQTLGTREEVKACLNRVPSILQWRTDLPNSFYLISLAQTANELVDQIVECAGKKGRFIIAEIDPAGTGVQGYLLKATWAFLGLRSSSD